MEIVDFLRLRPRRIAILLFLVLLVAVPTATSLLTRSPSYVAVASVQGTLSGTSGSDGQEHALILDEFQGALTTSPVLGSVARRTGVSVSALGSMMKYQDPTDPGLAAQVRVTGTNVDLAVRVAQVGASETLAYLNEQEMAESQATARVADLKLGRALKQLRTATTSNGAIDVETTSLAQEIETLQSVQAGTSQTDLTGQIAELKAQLNKLNGLTGDYGSLQAAFSSALVANEGAVSARLSAEADSTLTDAQNTVSVAVARQGRTKSAAVGGFATGAVVLLGALLIIALLEVRTGRVATLTNGGGDDEDIGRPDGASHTAALVGSYLVRHLRGRVLQMTGLFAMIVIAPLVAIGILGLAHSGKTALAVAIGLPAGVISLYLAVTHFEVFLLFLLVIRAGIDSIGNSGSVDPATAVGAVFIVASALWLTAQWHLGRWQRTSAVTKWLWLFAAACVISIPTSVDPTFSSISTSKAIGGVLMFSVLEQYLGQRPERVGRVIGCVLLSCISPIAIGLEQALLGHGNTDTAGVSRVMGNFSHPSTFALYLMLVFPFAFVTMRGKKGWYRASLLVISAVSVVLVILTYTRAAWIGILVMGLYLGFKFYRKKALWSLALLAVLIPVVAPSVVGRISSLSAKPVATGAPSNSFSWRIGYWEKVIPLADSDPITGIGFDGVQKVEAVGLQPHDGFVEAYVETGVLGLVAICGVVWSIVLYLRRRIRVAVTDKEKILAMAAVAAAIGVAFQFPVENLLTQTYVYWYFAAAMTFGFSKSRREPLGRSASKEFPPDGLLVASARERVGAFP
jgi:putative inorganic carbon (HCO3(-)) transporter